MEPDFAEHGASPTESAESEASEVSAVRGPDATGAAGGGGARYRTLFDHVPVGLFRMERGGRLTDANFTLVRMLGYPDRETLLATAPGDLFVRRSGWRVLETLLDERGRADRLEVQLRRHGGDPVWVRVDARAVRGDDGGEPAALHVEGAVVDITSRKQAEDALRESEERYRLLFEQDLTGNFIFTPDGRLLACNPAFVEIFGFESVEHALRAGIEPISPDPAAREAFVERMRRERRVDAQSVTLRRLDGTPVHLIANAHGIFDESDALVEIRGHLIDVTEQMQLEEQLRQAQKMEAIGRLAGGVAHDFNNLMMTVSGYAQLALQDLDEASPVRDDIEEIAGAVDRANALTRQLLAFGRRQVMNPSLFDANDLLRDLERVLGRMIGDDVVLETVLAPELGRVRADPGQLEQVVLNLVVNSRDAMPDGGTLTIRTAERRIGTAAARRLGLDRAGRYVALAVEDTGEGMDEETRARIFEPFFTTKSKEKGTGLGLSTVYGIVKQSGGTIRVESRAGRGATFEVLLPVADGGDEPGIDPGIMPVPPGAVASRGSAGRDAADGDADGGDAIGATGAPAGERVLLVEDEAPVRQLIRRILAAAGYEVVEAENGRHALEVAADLDEPVDVLVTDVVMPELGGRELAERLVGEHPDMAVLFLSGYSEAAVQSYGVFDMDALFCPKPVKPSVLRRRVRAALAARAER